MQHALISSWFRDTCEHRTCVASAERASADIASRNTSNPIRIFRSRVSQPTLRVFSLSGSPTSFLSRFTRPFHRTSSSSSSLVFHFLLIPIHPTRPIFLILARSFSFLLFRLSLFFSILSFCWRPFTIFSTSLDHRVWFLNVAIVGRNASFIPFSLFLVLSRYYDFTKIEKLAVLTALRLTVSSLFYILNRFFLTF